jgi:hypothetical protein
MYVVFPFLFLPPLGALKMGRGGGISDLLT